MGGGGVQGGRVGVAGSHVELEESTRTCLDLQVHAFIWCCEIEVEGIGVMASTSSAVMDATLSHAWPRLLNVSVPVIGALCR